MTRPSKSQVRKAGNLIRKNQHVKKINPEALDIISKWRSFHIYPLKTFQATLRIRLKRNKIPKVLIAQRLKMVSTIVDKLSRESTMQLNGMQDIGGLRVVVHDIDAVKKLEKLYDKGQFKHQLQKKDDYIKSPKDSGYRSIHLVYKTVYPQGNEHSDLLIELQIRTELQHVWATAVETVGSLLRQGLKFGKGSQEWKDFFALVSSAFAILENSKKLDIHQNLSDDEIFEKIRGEYSRLKVEEVVKSLATSVRVISEENKKQANSFCLITLNLSEMQVNIKIFSRSKQIDAIEELLKSEKSPDHQSVLVSMDDIDKIRKAYPNYFFRCARFFKYFRGKNY